MQLTPALRAKYASLWASAVVLPSKKAQLLPICQKLAANRSRYEAVEKETGVPWYFIACVHMRESSANFSTFLGNGEPLNRVTRLVPKGMGPWPSWEAGAIDALKHQGLDQVKTWDIAEILFRFEAYNGFGYASKGIPSPYVWSFTSHYTRGKYVADGQFSPSTIDPQPGCAAMLLILQLLVPTLLEKVIPMAFEAVTNAITPAVSSASAVPSAGVTVNKTQNLATHLIVFVGAALGALGLSQVHSIYDALTSSSLIGGMIVALLGVTISHLNIGGANDNTIDLIDKIVVALTPAQPADKPAA